MLLIFEGPDGAGKSSLAALVADVLSAEGQPTDLVHFGPPKFDPRDPRTAGEQSYDEMMSHELVADYSPASGRHLIMDRFHMGCPIYGPLYRPHLNIHEGYGEMTAEQYHRIDTWIRKNSGATYVMIPPVDLLFERVSADGDDYVTEKGRELRDRLEAFANGYAKLASTTPSAQIIQHCEDQDEMLVMSDYVIADSVLRDIRLARTHKTGDHS